MIKQFYSKKAQALKALKPGEIVCNQNIKEYFISKTYTQFQFFIASVDDPCFYELVKDNTPVNLFFDIEIHKNVSPDSFDNHESIVQHIKETVTAHFIDYFCKFIILEAHDSDSKRSYHIIVRMLSPSPSPNALGTSSNQEVYLPDVKSIKPLVVSLFKDLTKAKIIDTSVYREGLFRTYLSSKTGQNRPLVKSDLSDEFEFNETFVGYTKTNLLVEPHFLVSKSEVERPERENASNSEVGQDLTEGDKETIKKFVRRSFHYRPCDIRDVVLNTEYNCFNVNLNEKFCHNVDREHKSNHQYIVIDSHSAKQKCHDEDCADYKHNEVNMSNYPLELNEIILKCLKVDNQEQELIEQAIQECRDYINQNFDTSIQEIEFDRNQMIFRGRTNATTLPLQGTCPECNVEHHISDDGYCLKCTVCNAVFPKNQVISVQEQYRQLNTFWSRYNQLINNGTVNININNFYNGEEEFSCDVQLDKNIIRDKRVLKIVNECLDGHKITKLAEIMHYAYKNYVFTGNEWFLFDDNKWVLDNKSLNFKKNILELCNLFNKIKTHYEAKSTDDTTVGLIKNIKSLITKINKPQLKEDILKEAQLFYIDNEFFSKLNSKKHLVPFENGAYDLLDRKFRASKREDYINYTVKYDFDENVNNPEVHKFINSVLPVQSVRDYVLKKMSECLNGDIPNTNFLMFIGDGANGKSQLLNLMKLAMGEFGEKVEVTLLTRKRNNANEANTEKIKLMNKRFAFLSEPEDGEKINIGLLKELTGSEEIVARGLYQESVSFVMEAKLYLACNELPEIKGEDTALWRRIRVVDFPSRFVDEPKKENVNEYKIDKTLPSKMREDVTWRQTFVNILLDYYYKDVREPLEVQLKTNEYRDDNNEIAKWVEENLLHSANDYIALKDVCQQYFQNKIKVGVKEKSKLKKELEKVLEQKFPNASYECVRTTIDGQPFHGWLDFKFME
jgi:P4 family phage/plasmid primase-like protien